MGKTQTHIHTKLLRSNKPWVSRQRLLFFVIQNTVTSAVSQKEIRHSRLREICCSLFYLDRTLPQFSDTLNPITTSPIFLPHRFQLLLTAIFDVCIVLKTSVSLSTTLTFLLCLFYLNFSRKYLLGLKIALQYIVFTRHLIMI